MFLYVALVVHERRKSLTRIARVLSRNFGIMKAVVTGMIATYPVAGVLWDYVQYLLGLERLGFDVYYLEDSGLDSYHPDPCSYLEESLVWFSPRLKERWHYRTTTGQSYGVPRARLEEIIRESALFLNVSGGCLMRDEYMNATTKVLIDTDPGLNHFVNYPKWDAAPGWEGTHGYRSHDFFFTYAENFGQAGCILPDLGLSWHPTRPPVVMDLWSASSQSGRWTTVMSWKPFQHYQQEILYCGKTYGAKELEFQKFESLPLLTSSSLEVAVAGAEAPIERWRALGWSVIDASIISSDPGSYRDYIQNSRGEFSIAKNVYVATLSGWFSCRSVCYLAAGCPVVVQDTGFSRFIPTGNGLFAFSNAEEALQGLESVESEYERHGRAARELARAQFASDVVLGEILRKIGL